MPLQCPVVRKEKNIMTTKNKNKGQIANPDELITALYCRLSVEDMKDHDKKEGEIDESNSITNQKQILLDYAKKHNYKNTMFFVDDGISGTRFDREAFQRMQRMAENGEISRIIVISLTMISCLINIFHNPYVKLIDSTLLAISISILVVGLEERRECNEKCKEEHSEGCC